MVYFNPFLKDAMAIVLSLIIRNFDCLVSVNNTAVCNVTPVVW